MRRSVAAGPAVVVQGQRASDLIVLEVGARTVMHDTAHGRRLRWATSRHHVHAGLVGVLTAPTALLSSDMMDNSLLYVFAAVVIGGLTSFAGAFLGGVSVGVVQAVAYPYGGADVALLAVFALLLTVLIVRPYGVLGSRVAERL